VILQNEPTEP